GAHQRPERRSGQPPVRGFRREPAQPGGGDRAHERALGLFPRAGHAGVHRTGFPAGGGSDIVRTRTRPWRSYKEASMETLALAKELEPKVYSSLGQCPLFRALKPEQLPQLVKVAELLRYEPGETVVKEGDPSDSFYVFVEGRAAVTVSKGRTEPVEVGEIPLPSTVGEVSLLLGEPRTASVTA